MYIHKHKTRSLCCTPETNTTLQIRDASIKKDVKAIQQEKESLFINDIGKK